MHHEIISTGARIDYVHYRCIIALESYWFADPLVTPNSCRHDYWNELFDYNVALNHILLAIDIGTNDRLHTLRIPEASEVTMNWGCSLSHLKSIDVPFHRLESTHHHQISECADMFSRT